MATWVVLCAGCAVSAPSLHGAQDRNSENLSARIAAAVEAASPKDTVPIYTRAVRMDGWSMNDKAYRYEFAEIDRLEKEYQGVPRAAVLGELFTRATKGHEADGDNEKWLAVLQYFYRAICPSQLEQPMYPDRSIVTDPLILLALHNGSCGHVARVIVDLALANHYNARLVQLAAHLVAEVQWSQKWHWVDADSGIPVASLRARFATLPSLEQLAATNPYVLDGFAFRAWQWSDSMRRTLDGEIVPIPPDSYYPGELLPSTVYFGRQIFSGVYGGSTPRKPELQYYYKQGSIAQWENDRYWGWKDLRKEIHLIPGVPADYAPFRLKISGPEAVYTEHGRAVIPVRWTAQGRPVCQADQVRNCRMSFDELGYEVRVSSATRGWDYDFRDYDYMPNTGRGDMLVTRKARKIDATTFGIDLPVHDVSETFIEVVPMTLDKVHAGEFMWPSNELRVRVGPQMANQDHSQNYSSKR